MSNIPNGQPQEHRIFFLDGPGGSGKSYLYNYLICDLKSQGFKLASSAFTGIADILLKDGITIHSLFKLPVPVLDNSTCNVRPNSDHAEYLREQDLFLLDEASMISTHAFHAIDRMLRDICGNNNPFGGKVILIGGDFRQVLPVVKRARPAEIVEICLKSSPLW